MMKKNIFLILAITIPISGIHIVSESNDADSQGSSSNNVDPSTLMEKRAVVVRKILQEVQGELKDNSEKGMQRVLKDKPYKEILRDAQRYCREYAKLCEKKETISDTLSHFFSALKNFVAALEELGQDKAFSIVQFLQYRYTSNIFKNTSADFRRNFAVCQSLYKVQEESRNKLQKLYQEFLHLFKKTPRQMHYKNPCQRYISILNHFFTDCSSKIIFNNNHFCKVVVKQGMRPLVLHTLDELIALGKQSEDRSVPAHLNHSLDSLIAHELKHFSSCKKRNKKREKFHDHKSKKLQKNIDELVEDRKILEENKKKCTTLLSQCESHPGHVIFLPSDEVLQKLAIHKLQERVKGWYQDPHKKYLEFCQMDPAKATQRNKKQNTHIYKKLVSVHVFPVIVWQMMHQHAIKCGLKNGRQGVSLNLVASLKLSSEAEPTKGVVSCGINSTGECFHCAFAENIWKDVEDSAQRIRYEGDFPVLNTYNFQSLKQTYSDCFVEETPWYYTCKYNVGLGEGKRESAVLRIYKK